MVTLIFVPICTVTYMRIGVHDHTNFELLKRLQDLQVDKCSNNAAYMCNYTVECVEQDHYSPELVLPESDRRHLTFSWAQQPSGWQPLRPYNGALLKRGR